LHIWKTKYSCKVFARGWERGGQQGWGGLNQRMARAIGKIRRLRRKKEHPVMGAP